MKAFVISTLSIFILFSSYYYFTRPYDATVATGVAILSALLGALLSIVYGWVMPVVRAIRMRKRVARSVATTSNYATGIDTVGSRQDNTTGLLGSMREFLMPIERTVVFYFVLSLTPAGASVLYLLLSLVIGCAQPVAGLCTYSALPFGPYISYVGGISLFLLFAGPVVLVWWYLGLRAWYYLFYYLTILLSRRSRDSQQQAKDRKRIAFDLTAGAVSIGVFVLLVLLS